MDESALKECDFFSIISKTEFTNNFKIRKIHTCSMFRFTRIALYTYINTSYNGDFRILYCDAE